jgi:hypothetical protein
MLNQLLDRGRVITVIAAIVLTLASLTFFRPASAADKPEANAVERARPYLQPAVLALQTESAGIVYDSFVNSYIGEDGFVDAARDAAVFGGSSFCTGFAVSSAGHIASAGHCVDPKEESALITRAAAEYANERYSDFYEGPKQSVDEMIDVQGYEVRHGTGGDSGPDQKFTVSWDVATGDVESGKTYPARVLDFSSFEKGDGALLKAEVSDILAVALSDEKIEIGKEVVAIGYPGSAEQEFDKDLKPSYNDGKVSSEATDEGLFKAYELTAMVNGGMSGGPVADGSGQVIGFNSFNLLDAKPISYARPTTFIRELMAGKGVENSLNGASKAYRAGLDAYFEGEKDVAVEQLTTAVEADEDNAVAEEFLAKAERLEGDTNWLLLAGLPVLVLLLVGGVLAVLLARRNRASAGPAPVEPSPAPAVASTEPAPSVVAGSSASSTVVPEPSTDEPPAVPTPPQQPVGFATAAPEAPATRSCPPCGRGASPGEKFCSDCGTRLPEG